MKLKRTCRDVTRLVLEGEERSLSLSERLQVRLHMWICAACPRFERQVRFMRRAMGAWKGYAESDELSPGDRPRP
jgi:hypothetical protein